MLFISTEGREASYLDDQRPLYPAIMWSKNKPEHLKLLPVLFLITVTVHSVYTLACMSVCTPKYALIVGV